MAYYVLLLVFVAVHCQSNKNMCLTNYDASVHLPVVGWFTQKNANWYRSRETSSTKDGAEE